MSTAPLPGSRRSASGASSWTEPRPWAQLRRWRGSADLVVVFPSLVRDAGPVSGGGLYGHLPAHVLVYSNWRPEWRARGLAGLVEAVPDIADDIRAIGRDLGAERVFTTGESYGGYCALLFGVLLRARRIFAFGAETAIGLPAARSQALVKDRPVPPSPYADLLALMRETPPHEAHLFCGEDDLTDLSSALRLKDVPGVTLHAVPDCGHSVQRRLHQLGTFRATMDALVADRFDAGVLGPRGTLLDGREEVELWRRGFDALRAKRFGEAERELRAFLAGRPRTPSALRHLAQATRRAAEPSAAPAARPRRSGPP